MEPESLSAYLIYLTVKTVFIYGEALCWDLLYPQSIVLYSHNKTMSRFLDQRVLPSHSEDILGH